MFTLNLFCPEERQREKFSPEYFSVIELKVKIKQCETHLPSHYWGFICIDFSAVRISSSSLSRNLETLRSHLRKGDKGWIVTVAQLYRSRDKYVIWSLHMKTRKKNINQTFTSSFHNALLVTVPFFCRGLTCALRYSERIAED